MRIITILLVIVVASLAPATAQTRLSGSWQLDQEASTAIDPWRDLRIVIDSDDSSAVIKRIWSSGARRVYTDSVHVRFGSEVRLPLPLYPERGHLAAFASPGATRHVHASRSDDGAAITTRSDFKVATSQGEHPVRLESQYQLAEDGESLIVHEQRSTRPTAQVYVLRRITD